MHGLCSVPVEVPMFYEELLVQARLDDLRRDIERWHRGQAALAELRAGQPQPRFGFRPRPRRGAWGLKRERPLVD